MDKRDIYDSKQRWESWKLEAEHTKIEGLSDYNQKLIKEFLNDWELGKNVSKSAPKGERSYIRLLSLKSRLIFISKQFNKKLIELNKDDVHQLFNNMKTGTLKKSDGGNYKSTGDYIKDLKCFWSWLIKTGRAEKDICEDLSRKIDEKPAWVYLTEPQFKKLANRCSPDYKTLVWLMYDSGCRVTEGYSLKVSDFQNDFKVLTIREITSKNKFERTINLKLSSQLVKEYIEFHNLKNDDFIFQKKQPAFNKYLKTLSKKLYGTGVSHPKAKGTYDKFTLYDIRHNASCYWLKRYSNHSGLMYRMAWTSERFIRYYSEFIGMSDKLTDADMILTEDKSRLETQKLELAAQKKLIEDLNQKIDMILNGQLQVLQPVNQTQKIIVPVSNKMTSPTELKKYLKTKFPDKDIYEVLETYRS